MGKVKKILETELVGGTQEIDVYPVTSTKAVYDENNERLDHILSRRGIINVSTNYNEDHIAEVLTLQQAINKVPLNDRVLGFTMTFLSSEGWKTYQYIGRSIANWSYIVEWNEELKKSDLTDEVGNSGDKVISQKGVTTMSMNEFILKSARIKDVSNNWDKTTYNNSVINSNGEVINNFSTWKVHEIHSKLKDNKVFYVEFLSNSAIVENFVTVAVYRESDDSLVGVFNPEGRTVVSFRPFYYIKVTTSSVNHTVIGGTTVIQDTDTLEDLSEEVDNLDSRLLSYSNAANKIVEEQQGYYNFIDGEFTPQDGYYSCKFDIVADKDYYLTTRFIGSFLAGAVYINNEGRVLGYELNGQGSSSTIVSRYKLTIPIGTTKVLCSCNYYSRLNLKLEYSQEGSIDKYNRNKLLIDSYQWIRTGIDLGNIIMTSYPSEIGALRPDGGIDGSHSNYVTYTVKNTNTSNSFLFIKSEHDGNLPTAFCTVAILSESNNDVVFYARLHGKQIIAIQKGYYARICLSDLRPNIQTSYRYVNLDYPSPLDKYWKNKKGAWFGTSIPAQGYPTNCGKYLEMTMYNEAQGSSMCRAGRRVHTPNDPLGDVYGVTGVAWQNICYSLSLNQAEKHDIFINWTTERRKANLKLKGYTDSQLTNVVGFANLMAGNFYGEGTDTTIISPSSKPNDIMSSNYNTFRKRCYACSWDTSNNIEEGFGKIEGKIQKYLNWDNTVDLWILDHGHNDNLNLDHDSITYYPDDPYDRWTFLGSMNFIIKQIYDFNPRARIVIIGHYENTTNGYKQTCDAQMTLANLWDIPIYKCWENFQMAKSKVITTNAYWDKSGAWHDSGFDGSNGYEGWRNDSDVDENIRLEDGTWVHDMTMLRVWMNDALHPSSNPAKDYYGRLCALFIKNNV